MKSIRRAVERLKELQESIQEFRAEKALEAGVAHENYVKVKKAFLLLSKLFRWNPPSEVERELEAFSAPVAPEEAFSFVAPKPVDVAQKEEVKEE